VRERIELGHSVVDFTEQIAPFRRTAQQLIHDLAMPSAERGGRLLQRVLVAGGRSFGTIQECVSDACECRYDDNGASGLRGCNLDGVGDGGGVSERGAAELVDGYGQLRRG
jgi:hypothetical protein